MPDQKISELNAAAPLVLADNVLIERGAVAPNLRASIAQILALGSGVSGAGVTDTIPVWSSASSLGNSPLKVSGTNLRHNAGASGATIDPDFDNFTTEGAGDGGFGIYVGANRLGGVHIESTTGAATWLYDTGNKEMEIATHDAAGTILLRPGVANTAAKVHANGSVTIGGSTKLSNQVQGDLLLAGAGATGALILKETAEPTADENFGKVYNLSDNRLHYQDGSGAAHTLAHTGEAPTAHTIASHSDTTATGTELNTLVNGGSADGLHTHSLSPHAIASHVDTDATGAELDELTDGSITALHMHGGGSHTIASHSDTSATGAELDSLTDNSMVDSLHRHSELSASGGAPTTLTLSAAGGVTISGVATTEPTLTVSRSGAPTPDPVVKFVQDTLAGGGDLLELQQDEIAGKFITFTGSDRGVISPLISIGSVRVDLNGTLVRLAIFEDA